MTEIDFFTEIEHTRVTWQGYHLHVPVFYDHASLISATFLAPYDAVKAELPTDRLYPMPVMPGKAAVSVMAVQYLDSDIGPYNEVIVGIPVSLDQRLPLFTGSFRKMPSPMMSYVHTIPVTTEIAHKVGVDFAGYPKFIADIGFTEDEDWQTCTLSLDGEFILSLKGRKLKDLASSPRVRSWPLTHRDGYLLRSEMTINAREAGFSRNKADAVLTLGDHQVAEPLKKMGLSSPASYFYIPNYKIILTPVIESFKV